MGKNEVQNENSDSNFKMFKREFMAPCALKANF